MAQKGEYVTGHRAPQSRKRSEAGGSRRSTGGREPRRDDGTELSTEQETSLASGASEKQKARATQKRGNTAGRSLSKNEDERG